MCGVSGVLARRDLSQHALLSIVESMTPVLRHRGPDDAGHWTDQAGRVAFGHRRLSIIDLSPAGHQPMTSRDGRWTVCYNGELYNTDELALKAGLDSLSLRGHSDTEVLVESIARRGVDFVVREAIGMFAFAVWDSLERELWLARDRFGEKPLYIAQTEDFIGFASQLSALRVLPGLDTSVDSRALHDLLSYGYVVGSRSIMRGVRRLPAGSIVRVTDRDGIGDPRVYWSATEAASVAEDSPPMPDSELVDLLSDVVRSRMIADVPLGAFLSGGIDSSLVVALMARASERPVKTFTIGFGSNDHDESSYARRVAAHLNTEHHEWILGDSEVLASVPRLPEIYDEPFADSSQIPTFLLSQLTRQHVSVALSGDGGDELFGGYDRYRGIRLQGRLGSWSPRPMKSSVAKLLLSRSSDEWNTTLGRVPTFLLPPGFRRRKGERIRKLGRMLGAKSTREAYEYLLMVDPDADRVTKETVDDQHSSAILADPIRYAMLQDTAVYLPDDILTKVDRASMANSLEVRVPLLDPRVFDAAWRIPRSDLIGRGVGKRPVRNILGEFIPPDLIDRPKMGFGVPLAEWLRGPLRSWGDNLLDPVAIDAQGLLAGSVVRERWIAHQSGSADFSAELWPVLMFQAWFDRWN